MTVTEHSDNTAAHEADAVPASSRRDQALASEIVVAFTAIAVLLFMVRVFGGMWPRNFKIFFPDSFSFLNAARHTPFSPAFYAAERPIAFPTLLFLLGRSTALTIFVQTALYALAFVFAARTAWMVLRHHVARVAGIAALCVIALEPRFALWNSHILSESIGMTLSLMSVMLWWRFSSQPTVVRLRWASLATIAWLTARDSNVPPWAAVGVPALLLASFWWRSADRDLRLAMRRWAAVTLVVCVGVTLTQAANGRNRYATLNNVGQRVLPYENLTNWFVGQGMPMSDALRERTGSSSFDDQWKMLESEDLAEFRAWARGPGQREMLMSYARFAPHWVRSLKNDLPVLLASNQAEYDAFHVAARLPKAASNQLGGPTTPFGLLIWTLAAVGGIALALRQRRVQAVVLSLLLASTFVDLYMAYVGDSVEVQRHMVGPLSRMAIILVMCVAIGVDSIAVAVKQRRREVA